jgi:hypothetical protein
MRVKKYQLPEGMFVSVTAGIAAPGVYGLPFD